MKILFDNSEAQLVERVCNFLANDGYCVRLEVPNMGQSTDIVATRNGWVWAIEAKIGNWKRAVEQCKAHELVADFVCVALDRRPTKKETIRAFEILGYGLICVSEDHNLEWVIKPTKNNRVWKPQRQTFLNSLKDIGYACRPLDAV